MDIYEAIMTRRSVRAYGTKPIPDEILRRMRRVLRSAPSACNHQPWAFILVTEPGRRERLAMLAHDQQWMAAAPVIVVACGLTGHAYRFMGGRGNSVEIDVAIALDHLTLAAVGEGLGTCWIGAFDEDAVKEFLGVPKPIRVVAMTPLGYPASPDLNHPLHETDRKPEEEIFFREHYGRREDDTGTA